MPSVDLFVEDQAHEEFVGAIVRRRAKELGKDLKTHFRSARGGHGRVLDELRLYQASVLKQYLGLVLPDVLVVAIDANCKRFYRARDDILDALDDKFKPLAAIACPDPHVERWFLADPPRFQSVVGATVRPGRRKCEKSRYKTMVAQAVTRAGHPPTLGGIEFAGEIVEAMDFYSAGRAEPSLKAFLDDLDVRLQAL
jgi:hypothetical protein